VRDWSPTHEAFVWRWETISRWIFSGNRDCDPFPEGMPNPLPESQELPPEFLTIVSVVWKYRYPWRPEVNPFSKEFKGLEAPKEWLEKQRNHDRTIVPIHGHCPRWMAKLLQPVFDMFSSSRAEQLDANGAMSMFISISDCLAVGNVVLGGSVVIGEPSNIMNTSLHQYKHQLDALAHLGGAMGLSTRSLCDSFANEHDGLYDYSFEYLNQQSMRMQAAVAEDPSSVSSEPPTTNLYELFIQDTQGEAPCD
jgi:hypothetical protein